MGKLYEAFEKSRPLDQREPLMEIPKEGEKPEPEAAGLQPWKAEAESKAFDRRLITLLDPQSYEAEQFKSLRTKLLFPEKGSPARSLMITSSVPGEGKTFVAVNLAVSIAQNINEHVLLVDCDIRRPGAHKYFGFGHVPGLAEYLGERIPNIADVMIRPPGISKLTILPGGNPPHNPSELLSSKKMADLLDEIKQRYDDRYIIIDSPPPEFAPETSAIARKVDGILLVVKCAGPSQDLVEAAINSVGKEKIRGVFFNRFDTAAVSDYRYKRYSYQYRAIVD